MIEELQELTGEISLNQELTGELDKIVEVIEPVTQEKEITPTKQTQSVQPDEGYNGLSQVTVNPIPPEYIIPALDSKSITANGTYNASDEALDGYSSVNVNVDAFQVNGKIENKFIQSGNIAKGDFVVNGTFEKQDRVSSRDNYYSVNTVYIEHFDNLFDANDDNYAYVFNNSSICNAYFNCKSREQLNIPADAKLLNISVTYKVSYSNVNAINKGVYFHKFMRGVVGQDAFNIGQEDYGKITTGYPIIHTYTFDSDMVGSEDDTTCFGIRVYCWSPVQSYIYYILFNVTYEDNGEIKKVSSLTDNIVGIANESGTQGDTIEVYIPNVE